MTNEKAIKLLMRMQEPEPYEPQITEDAFEALQMAIEALEKQTPKEPVIDFGFPEKIRAVMIRKGDVERAKYKTECCPNCRHLLGSSQFVKAQTGKVFGDKFCKHCGQAIRWSEENG